MDEVCTSKIADCLGVDFCNAILMMRTNTAEGELLLLMLTVVLEFLLSKNTIVRVIGFNLPSEIMRFLLNNLLAT